MVMASDRKRRKPPSERKRLDYLKQRRGFSEYAHALRHGKWRKKRRYASGAERRRVAELLASGAGDPGDLDAIDPGRIRRKRIQNGAPRLSANG